MAEQTGDPQVAQAIKIGISATSKGDHVTALKVFKAVYDNPSMKAPADGLSYYGLSLATHEKQTARGVQLCKEAIAAQFFDERHYENLVRIHLNKGNRTNAQSALEDGLKNVPNSSRLARLQQEMGLAAPKPKTGDTGKSPRLDLKSLPPVVAIIAGALFFALVFGVTFWITYQQAYGP